ncbi:MAG: hypothetical protein Q7S27_05480 [Nanoarchaeota archaeon]|nr:hypothetical protein [Nanoarchaeota archaeon]
MEITDKVTFEHRRGVESVNVDELIKTLESNGIKIDPAISEKVVNYGLELHPHNRTVRESFVPIGIDTQDLSVVGYILRDHDEKGRLEIDLKNSQRGSVMSTYNVPNFQIKVESDAEYGMEIINNVRRSLEYLGRKIAAESGR